MIEIAVMFLSALVNRFRGGGVIPLDLPGHRRFWSAPMIAAIAAIVLDWRVALVFAACWLWWALLPWGRWYTIGRGERDWSGPPDGFERVIERIADALAPNMISFPYRWQVRITSDHLALALRNVVALAPLAGLISIPAALIVMIGMSLAYEIAWQMVPEERGPTGWAEWATGAFWGLALIVGA
jgi:hypothetical protein